MRFSDLNESRATFRLHPKCKPEDFQITDSFRSIDKWKAKSIEDAQYTEEAGGFKPAGTWMEVGYIMIARKDDTIIPLSRADEHHVGYDVLSDHYKLSYRDFVSVWCLGNNYVYGPQELDAFKVVLPKYLAYGGNPNALLIGVNDLRGVKQTVADFVAGKPFQKHEGTELSSQGKLVVAGFQKVAEALIACRADQTGNPRLLNVAKKDAIDLMKLLTSFHETSLGVFWRDFDACSAAVRAAKNEQEISELIFGFGGIKNKMHNNMKKINEDPKSWGRDDAFGFWGNLEMAIDALGRF